MEREPVSLAPSMNVLLVLLVLFSLVIAPSERATL